MTQAWGTPSQPKTIMITTCSSVGGRRIKSTKHSVIHLHLNESVVNFQNLGWNIQLFMHHICQCNQRVTLKGQFLPDRLISSSVSLSRLPALLTMFIKWMAVQANGIRYRPRRWQNCSDWLRSFSSFSLFWKWRQKKQTYQTRLVDSINRWQGLILHFKLECADWAKLKIQIQFFSPEDCSCPTFVASDSFITI